MADVLLAGADAFLLDPDGEEVFGAQFESARRRVAPFMSDLGARERDVSFDFSSHCAYFRCNN